jgi:hypothetical protein
VHQAQAQADAFFARLDARRAYLQEVITAKRRLGWDPMHYETEHAALVWALGALVDYSTFAVSVNRKLDRILTRLASLHSLEQQDMANVQARWHRW